LATPNYGYEKRQRELAKKKKKEEKARAKSQRAPGDTSGGDYSMPEPAQGAAVEPGQAPDAAGGTGS
jgi:hypothetical protein